MLVKELLEKYHIRETSLAADFQDIVFYNPCEEMILQVWRDEHVWLETIAEKIRKVLKTQGAKETDRQFHALFFNWSGEGNFSVPRNGSFHAGEAFPQTGTKGLSGLKTITSSEQESEEAALKECVSILNRERSVLLQEYFFTEKKKGIFSKKTCLCSLRYEAVRWNGFFGLAKDMAKGFFRCMRTLHKSSTKIYFFTLKPKKPLK